MDPQGGDADFLNGQYATNDGSGWTVHTNVTPVPVHVMDGPIVTAEGTWLFGASNTPDPPDGGATVWLSPDGGTTWETSLAPRPTASGYDRFYAACVLGTDLFAARFDGTDVLIYRRTAGVWTQPETLAMSVSELIPFAIGGVNFALIIPSGKQSGFSATGTTAVLTALEDVAARPALLAALPPVVKDACVDGGYLYVMDDRSTLWRIDAAGTLTALLTSTTPAACFAIAAGHMYIGSTDSKVYKAPLPA